MIFSQTQDIQIQFEKKSTYVGIHKKSMFCTKKVPQQGINKWPNDIQI